MASPARLSMQGGHPRRGSRGERSVEPQGWEARELDQVCRDVGRIAGQKFSTVREAFRFISPDSDGSVVRSDIHCFFRAYGVDPNMADKFFTLFGGGDKQGADWTRFVEFMCPYIQPDGKACTSPPHSPHCCSDDASQASTRPPTPEDSVELDNSSGPVEQDKDIRRTLEIVHTKAPQRFHHAREALRIVDTDYDGYITRCEMRNFFRALGVTEHSSDRFYDMMARGNPNGVNYTRFVQRVGPHLDLPGIEAMMKTRDSCGVKQSLNAQHLTELLCSARCGSDASECGASDKGDSPMSCSSSVCSAPSPPRAAGGRSSGRRPRASGQDKTLSLSEAQQLFRTMYEEAEKEKPRSAKRQPQQAWQEPAPAEAGGLSLSIQGTSMRLEK